MRLAGKKVAIIGGASGIGLATARMALAEGASVIIGDNSPANLARTKSEFDGNASIKVMTVDVTELSQVSSFFAGMDQVDHVFLTAGILDRGSSSALTSSIESLRKILDTRLMGAAFVAREAKSKFAPGGSLTLTSGLDGDRPAKDSTFAAGSVEGVKGMVRGLAIDLKPIRVNAVVPGLIDTPLWAGYPHFKEFVEEFTKNTPIPRVGKAEDVADAAIFLMLNGYMTGTTVTVDGGAPLI